MNDVLSLFPQAAPYVTAAVAISAAVATILPPPPATQTTALTKVWAGAYAIINFVACNMGHATNATAPKGN
jgi:hypothetical protein